jgi:hypothetical protein
VRPGLQGLGLAGVVTLSLLAAACGGSSGASGAKVAQVDSTTTATTTGTEVSGRSKRDALVAFAACMRKHGVPKFPDPEVSGSGLRLSIGSEGGVDSNAPQFKRAQRACQELLPNEGKQTPQEQAKQLQEALDYAACMREHGVPNFPDPKAAGGGGIEFGAVRDTPELQSAQKACRKLLPGAPVADSGEKPRP